MTADWIISRQETPCYHDASESQAFSFDRNVLFYQQPLGFLLANWNWKNVIRSLR